MSKRKKEERGRFTARRKVEAVMRLLKGEDLDTVSGELGPTAATLSEWRDAFLASAEAGLKSREPSAADEENLRLRAKVGERPWRMSCSGRRRRSWRSTPHIFRGGSRGHELALREASLWPGARVQNLAGEPGDGVPAPPPEGRAAVGTWKARTQDDLDGRRAACPHPRRLGHHRVGRRRPPEGMGATAAPEGRPDPGESFVACATGTTRPRATQPRRDHHPGEAQPDVGDGCDAGLHRGGWPSHRLHRGGPLQRGVRGHPRREARHSLRSPGAHPSGHPLEIGAIGPDVARGLSVRHDHGNPGNTRATPFKTNSSSSASSRVRLSSEPSRATGAPSGSSIRSGELATVTEAIDSRSAHGQPGGDFQSRQERLGRNRWQPQLPSSLLRVPRGSCNIASRSVRVVHRLAMRHRHGSVVGSLDVTGPSGQFSRLLRSRRPLARFQYRALPQTPTLPRERSGRWRDCRGRRPETARRSGRPPE
jgi:transposase-like protein